MTSRTTKQAFQWDDPLSLEGQVTADERAVRDSAHAFCQERLLPRVQEAFRHDSPAWSLPSVLRDRRFHEGLKVFAQRAACGPSKVR